MKRQAKNRENICKPYIQVLSIMTCLMGGKESEGDEFLVSPTTSSPHLVKGLFRGNFSHTDTWYLQVLKRKMKDILL